MLYLAGFIGSVVITVVAFRRGSLAPTGALGAVLVGTLVTGGGGWGWGALLLVFFFSSSALSRLGRQRKAALAATWEKGARRDLGQVLANGGLFAVLATAYRLHPDPRLALAGAGALAAVNADTWATELGVLGGAPRLITTGRRTRRGESGAVSLPGTVAAAAGALAVGLAALGLAHAAAFPAPPGGELAVVLVAAGLVGSFADSLLGATLQANFCCPACRERTERRMHACGTATERVGGVPWLGNDGVNLLASGVGAAVAVLLAA